jgi:hypothetical protein
MLLNDLQEFNEQLPELVHCSNLQTLGGRVYATQGRAKRYHLEVRILLKEETALQACMDSTDLRLCIEQTTVALYRGLEQL